MKKLKHSWKGGLTPTLKVVALAFLISSAILGIYAHFSADLKKNFNTEACDLNPVCPDNWLLFERIFVGFVCAATVLGTINVTLSIFTDVAKDYKLLDVITMTFIGVLMLVAGSLLLTSAMQVYDFGKDTVEPHRYGLSQVRAPDLTQEFLSDLRHRIKYIEKVVAGVCALVSGILFLIAGRTVSGYCKLC